MKQKYLIILSYLFVTGLSAQQSTQSLKVGDGVPDLPISNITNYTSSFARVTDFKGKLLILDFWGVHCTSCIEEMPHMEALQKEFGDKIQVLLVTRDSKEQVNELLRKSAFVRNIHLPFVIGDTILSKYFPYNAFGLHIWIDGKGVVAQKTSGQSYSADNIRQFLQGQKLNLVQRQDDQHFNAGVPLWLEGNGRQLKRIQYYSYIAGNIPEYAQGGGLIIRDSATRKIIGFRNWNNEITGLFNMAFEQSRNRWLKTIWEVKDSSLFTPPKQKEAYAEWSLQHNYYYELKVPVERADRLYAFMRQDLERFFGITGKIENRKLKCLVLIRTPNADTLLHKSNGNSSLITVWDEDALRRDSIVSGNRFHLKALSAALEKYVSHTLVIIDETNYSEPVDLRIHASHDYETLRKELQKNGLDLVEAEREMKCLVLTEEGYQGAVLH